jgi:hypothetical protein
MTVGLLSFASLTTQLPAVGSLVTRFNAEAITPQSDNTTLTSWTDSINSVIAGTTLGTGPKYRTNRLNGKPSVQFSAGALTIATPGAMKTAIDSQLNTVFIIFKGMTGTLNSFGSLLAASVGADSFFYIADGGQVGRYNNGTSNQVPYTSTGFSTLGTTSWNTAQHGNGAGYEVQYVNGGAQYSVNIATAGTGGNTIAIGGRADNGFFCNAEIFEILIWNRPLLPWEYKQAQMWACDRYAQPYPWAGLTKYPVFFGDSITQFLLLGNVTQSAAWLAAQTLGLGLGQWDNFSSGGATMATLTSFAPTLVDPIHTQIGMKTPVITFEWFNQQDSTTTNGAAYLAARKAASSNILTVFGTSTDASSSANQVNRAAFDSAWDAAHTLNIDAYMAIHTDTHIGVNGSYATFSSAGDGVHLVPATTPFLAAFFSTGISSLP